MKMLRFAAVMMLATATTFACSDNDDGPTAPVAGSAGEGGDSTSLGGTTSGGGKGGTGTGGKAGGAQGGEGAAGGDVSQAGAAQGGAAREGGAGIGGEGGEALGGAAPGGAGGETVGGAGGDGPTACVNQFDSGDGGEGGQGGQGGEESGSPLEIVGDYKDNFGFAQVITAKLWNSSGIIEYDNDTNVVYLQNPCDALYGPNQFTKIVYTEPENGSFYFCYVDFSLPTLEAAKASTKVADASDPGKEGCGEFAWSKAIAQ